MEVSDIKRLKELDNENQRLKRMFADLSLKPEEQAPKNRPPAGDCP